MNPKIAILPDDVINKIAAGEVVENPASIVKELLENSLDAGAKRISIETLKGGYDLIRIEDDGCGMGKEDTFLSLKRHATSKIQSDEDLLKLSTMGFRGEALAAISSVSIFEMKTATEEEATHIQAEGGKILYHTRCARNPGTTIEVRSLFYNVPARKKFQKSIRASSLAVSRVVDTLALARPDVFFSLNGREFAPQGLRQRVEEILGNLPIEVQAEDIYGFLAEPSEAMATRTGQHLFVNQRAVFSPLISKAIKEGFGTRIPEQSYPRFVLFLKLRPDFVDVNVHPQKKEVRFREEETLFQKVKKSIEDSFSFKTSFSREVTFQEPQESFFFPTSLSSFEAKEEPLELDWMIVETPLALIGKYLLLQKEDLFLVDLKAAHARVLFETLQKENKSAQALLFPIQIPLSSEEEERLRPLEALGIEYRLLKKTLVIDALPPFLEPSDFPRFYAEWKEEKQLDQMICKFCFSSKKQYSREEAMHLLKELKKCKDTLYDPKGNPIFCKLSEENLSNLMKSTKR